ncbi:hypothetical protein NAPIS_ORF01404 [Vairimorpha apis BRL 01]|uniref:Uncharacterized protein n=1 Tax=Vairimorpha apis BRL 01 TaxID=1037528 RepID=T0L9B4_9MICR|nr:hypothetical protein NAPIS_ORF01404 [Vairimorpha apis BRL 01]
MSNKMDIVCNLVIFYCVLIVSEMLLIYNLSYYIREEFVNKNFVNDGKSICRFNNFNNMLNNSLSDKLNEDLNDKLNYCSKFKEDSNLRSHSFRNISFKNEDLNIFDNEISNISLKEEHILNFNCSIQKSILYEMRSFFFLISSTPHLDKPNFNKPNFNTTYRNKPNLDKPYLNKSYLDTPYLNKYDTFLFNYITLQTNFLISICQNIKQEHLNLTNKLFITVPQVNNTIRKYDNYSILDKIIYKSIYRYKIFKLKREFYQNMKYFEDINLYMNKVDKVGGWYERLYSEFVGCVRDLEIFCGIDFKIKAF